MDETDYFALVPRQPRALEKAERGTKRILYGMVADTLALARKELPTKPTFAVLLGLGDKTDKLLYDRFEKWFENKLSEKYSVRFVLFDCSTELLHLVQEQTFSLVVVSFTRTKWDTITDESFYTREGKIVEFLESLISQLRIPIVTPGGFDSESTGQLERAGVHVFVPYGAPFSTRAFWDTLQSCLPLRRDAAENDGDTFSGPRGVRPPRIVIMDDEKGPRRIRPVIYKHYYKDAAVLLFDDADEAITELSREDPDPDRLESGALSLPHARPLAAKLAAVDLGRVARSKR